MLIILSVCTAVVTSYLAGSTHARARVTDEGNDGGKAAGSTRVTKANNAPVAGIDASGDIALVAEMKMHPLQAEVDGEDVIVSTGADLTEAQPNRTYIWSFQVLSRDGKTQFVREQYYPHQAFRMPEGSHELHPTFSEHVKLLPGIYIVRINLYDLRPSNKRPDFAIGEKIQGVKPMSAIRQIVVGS